MINKVPITPQIIKEMSIHWPLGYPISSSEQLNVSGIKILVLALEFPNTSLIEQTTSVTYTSEELTVKFCDPKIGILLLRVHSNST